MRLGLDLQGGIHLILEVEEDKAVEGTVERLVLELALDFLVDGGQAMLKLRHLRGRLDQVPQSGNHSAESGGNALGQAICLAVHFGGAFFELADLLPQLPYLIQELPPGPFALSFA